MIREVRTASQSSKAKAKATLGFLKNLGIHVLEIWCCEDFARRADLTAMVELLLDMELGDSDRLRTSTKQAEPLDLNT